jgi:hypothetical protein
MGIFNAFVAYKFIKILSMPWKKTDAFKLGIIDKKGNILKKLEDLKTSEERKSYTIFHRLIWNLKKIIEKIPVFKSRIASFATALYLIKENAGFVGTNNTLIEDSLLDYLKENGYDVDSMMINESFEMRDGIIKRGLYVIEGNNIFIEENIKAFDEILGIPLFKIDFLGEEKIITKEEAVANVASSGEVAGLGDKPPVSKKPKVQRRTGVTGGIAEAKEYEPEKRRKLKTGEVEVMKGKGNRQKWFYLKNEEDVKQLIILGRNSSFPTGITNNNSRVKFDKDWYIKESTIKENIQTATSKDETPATFAGTRVFKVSSEEYCNCLQGRKKHERWKRKLNMDNIKNQAIRSYAHKNPGKSIIVQDDNTGEMSYLLR